MIKRVSVVTFFILSVAVLIYSILSRKRDFEKSQTKMMLKKNTQIHIKNRKFNLGKIKDFNQAKTQFYVHNVGLDTLFIENIEVSCDCTTLSGIGASVPPGDSLLISVAYTKKRFGYFYSDILIYGNFLNSPAMLSFEGYLLRP
ncbi:MAG: DUF1573 domain-containing protein [Cyclobacteriaceae bacterium]|nr:DUF1573 domain-containing protein [Cyclobacteriaceae bacterium]